MAVAAVVALAVFWWRSGDAGTAFLMLFYLVIAISSALWLFSKVLETEGFMRILLGLAMVAFLGYSAVSVYTFFVIPDANRAWSWTNYGNPFAPAEEAATPAEPTAVEIIIPTYTPKPVSTPQPDKTTTIVMRGSNYSPYYFGLPGLMLTNWPITPQGLNWAWIFTALSLLLPFLGTAIGIELAIHGEIDLMGAEWYYRNEARYEPRIRLTSLLVTLGALGVTGFVVINTFEVPYYLSWTRFLLGFPGWWFGLAAGGICAVVCGAVAYFIAYQAFN